MVAPCAPVSIVSRRDMAMIRKRPAENFSRPRTRSGWKRFACLWRRWRNRQKRCSRGDVPSARPVAPPGSGTSQTKGGPRLLD